MSALTEALDRILTWLKQYRASDIFLLQPGLSNAEIEDIVADLPWRLPQDIQELYQWKNGTKIIGEYHDFSVVFENWTFYPLQLVINGYREKIEYYKEIGYEPLFEHEHLNALNIFLSSELTDIGYVLIDEKTQETSQVIFQYCKGGDCSPIIKYANLTTMMMTIAECYENAYYVDTNGDFKLNSEQALHIWRKYNSERITEAALARLSGEVSLRLLFEVEIDLIQAKHSSCIKPLLELLHQPFVKPEIFTIRELAIKVLGELGDARAVEPLSQLTFDENNQVREAAKRALKKIGQKN